jgi:hypothetical protein
MGQNREMRWQKSLSKSGRRDVDQEERRLIWQVGAGMGRL